MAPHHQFLELCAISTTGELSEEERAKLTEHLATCSECRQALVEFEAAADIGAPVVAAELGSAGLHHDVLSLAEVQDSTSREQSTRPIKQAMDRRIQKGSLFAPT